MYCWSQSDLRHCKLQGRVGYKKNMFDADITQLKITIRSIFVWHPLAGVLFWSVIKYIIVLNRILHKFLVVVVCVCVGWGGGVGGATFIIIFVYWSSYKTVCIDIYIYFSKLYQRKWDTTMMAILCIISYRHKERAVCRNGGTHKRSLAAYRKE